MPIHKSEFRNTRDYMVGVVLYDQDGKPYGDVVQPGDTVWLSEQEQIATANAPKRPEDNPLANGTLVEVTPATEIANRRPLRPPAEGKNAEFEEVASPDAQKKATESEDEKEKQERPMTQSEIDAHNAKVAAARAVNAEAPASEQTAKKAPAKKAPAKKTSAKAGAKKSEAKTAPAPAQGKSAPGEEVATPVEKKD